MAIGLPAPGVGASKAPAKPAPAKPAPAPAKAPALSQSQQSAYTLMNQTLASWGLSSLAGELRKLIVGGDTSTDTLSLALSQTAQYKARFAGNAIREKNGLSDLLPAAYLSTEEQYRQVLQSYGLPSGFYDSHDDFTKLIGSDVSPTELDTRAKIAHDQFQAAPAATKQLWTSYFGLSQGQAVAAILDPTKATQLIQDEANQVAIGGAAAAQGFQLSQARANQFNQNGTTLAQAQDAYSKISQTFGTDQQIAQRFGTTFDQTQEENDLILGQGAATDKRQSLYDEEQGLFKGSAGANQSSLGVNQNY